MPPMGLNSLPGGGRSPENAVEPGIPGDHLQKVEKKENKGADYLVAQLENFNSTVSDFKCPLILIVPYTANIDINMDMGLMVSNPLTPPPLYMYRFYIYRESSFI